VTEGPARSPRRHRSHQSHARQLAVHLWSEWRVEMAVVMLVLLAAFLLVERIHIRQTLLHWLRQGIQGLSSFGGSIIRGFLTIVQNTTLSDLTAYVLLLAAFVFAALRTRQRLMTSPRLTTHECPRCGSELRRIHRNGMDRLLNLYVPVRRYKCGDHDCQWQGLRVRASRNG
jgi:hypothetical protein